MYIYSILCILPISIVVGFMYDFYSSYIQTIFCSIDTQITFIKQSHKNIWYYCQRVRAREISVNFSICHSVSILNGCLRQYMKHAAVDGNGTRICFNIVQQSTISHVYALFLCVCRSIFLHSMYVYNVYEYVREERITSCEKGTLSDSCANVMLTLLVYFFAAEFAFFASLSRCRWM